MCMGIVLKNNDIAAEKWTALNTVMTSRLFL
jgi:hypothetical protein